MNASRLSAIDAFFVAYPECSGVLMQLGVEVELKGRITREDLDRTLRHVVHRWRPLGQRLRERLFGLWWEGEFRTADMIRVAESREALGEWRNRPLNPFKEPPFQVLWIEDGDRHLLAFRAHHAVVDGEGFFAVCAEALQMLAGKQTQITRINADSSRVIRGLKIPEALATVQRMRDEARSNRSVRLAMRSCSPGDISVVERDLARVDLGATPGWLCASAWMKAIHAWNRSRGPDSSSLISLEVPVSLRRSRDNEIRIGNWISPLTLYGDATQPIEKLAQHLKQQMSRATRQRAHLALPLLASPGKFLPWSFIRKVAANPELTGFATSHFAWFEQSQTLHEEVLRVSNGALEIVDQQIYTPVCLHMGAAVSILAWPERAQIFLTHRLTAFSSSDAQEMLDLMVHELGQRYPHRQQVAV